ncbi:hypothetical protein ACJX0J_010216 [Zea mays]
MNPISKIHFMSNVCGHFFLQIFIKDAAAYVTSIEKGHLLKAYKLVSGKKIDFVLIIIEVEQILLNIELYMDISLLTIPAAYGDEHLGKKYEPRMHAIFIKAEHIDNSKILNHLIPHHIYLLKNVALRIKLKICCVIAYQKKKVDCAPNDVSYQRLL